MSKLINVYLSYAMLAFCFLATGIIRCDEGGIEQVVTKDALSFTLPNPFGETPLFETNDQDGRYMAMHIPWVYDGVLHFRESGLMSTKMSADIGKGLFSFLYDKTPQADGQLHGPVRMKLLWFTVYDNKE